MKKEAAVLILPVLIFLTLASPRAQTPRRAGGTPQPSGLTLAPQGAPSWEGTYKYQEGGGRTAHGEGMFVEHTIKLYRRNGELIADLDAAGFQVSTSLRCGTKAEGEKISLTSRATAKTTSWSRTRRGNSSCPLRRLPPAAARVS